ncbi:MAG: ribosomal RNA small subunit methyltransferase A [Flavobacteriales bacterium]|jgi:16S rRNA (adenine1518-N6/adenine1519-N6)-dimethyltransferase|nr:ribosomal RNA small subunit methyltransferase A [Flavobacteriales bacterium]MBK6893397.1 ribosomal RNA small subunit methyltransferase A [Flavobacteriales bacterium]MBK7248877.1 ribosomal RNA small subunit methyltransferase A [Flavobacteriales bacterium]MBK9058880.1 ribosomal RNA small subunit methyltransferase A [Flavobacteriales bacterium]MBK9600092.1 ribosomal RNA small subunit methyltransferase A [Flavobacteriales bacterium]
MQVRAKKHLGQHFLKDEEIALRITEALTHHGGYRDVIEVGPGTGALTKHLIGRTDIDLTCVELDRESVAHLHATWPELRVMQGDLLGMDLSRVGDGPLAVIGNFPYNISTQIVFKVLENRDRVTELVGMFQKEVADRLCAGPGSRTYGITSVLSQVWYDMEVLFLVEPDSFIPPPKVRSAVIRMRRNERLHPPCDEKMLFRVVKAAFSQRRKTLHNALKAFAPLKDGVPAEYARQRAEQLSVGDFITLTQLCAGPDA